MKRSFLLLLLFIVLFRPNAPQPPTKVLFIGNSYTYSNDLPDMFRELAKSGGYRVEIGIAAQAGWHLSDHVDSKETQDLLQSRKWDYVVLQEQSWIPSDKQERVGRMYPAARTLVAEIRKLDATPIFFVTWGHRDEWPKFGLLGYEFMQARVNQGYSTIAQELDTPIAPVGTAWRSVVRNHPLLNLWSEDGSHPTRYGTYLAACVFYAVIFHQSSEGLTYYADVPEDVAKILQATAGETVLQQ